jgi:hypothetical protein
MQGSLPALFLQMNLSPSTVWNFVHFFPQIKIPTHESWGLVRDSRPSTWNSIRPSCYICAKWKGYFRITHNRKHQVIGREPLHFPPHHHIRNGKQVLERSHTNPPWCRIYHMRSEHIHNIYMHFKKFVELAILYMLITSELSLRVREEPYGVWMCILSSVRMLGRFLDIMILNIFLNRRQLDFLRWWSQKLSLKNHRRRRPWV